MKSRLGFVSNSSSSSFVIVATKQAHENALARMKAEDAELVRKITAFKKFGQEEMVLVAGHTYDGITCSYSSEWTRLDKPKPKRLSDDDLVDTSNHDGDCFPLETATSIYIAKLQKEKDATTLHMDG